MATLRSAEQEQLQKLLLGQLPTAEIERMATEFADDSRLAELAESLVGKDDALLSLLQNHEASVVDPEGERLVERLLQRLKPAIPFKPGDETFAVNKADATTEPSSFNVAAMLPVLPERLEYYRPIKVLGQGGMGTVYLAEDTRLGREVAIKTLRPELAINAQAKERFLREARSAAKLEHDHIIPIYSVGEADGTPFLAMPFLKGEPLDALIRRAQGQLPVATAVRLAREVALGLAAAHARGLIHRDIKPANIWLEAPTGRVKILDFGLAKAADAGDEVDSETHLTASGAIVGTPAYMAPEQASGNPIDGRADLFSLGCVLYEVLTGRRAFGGANTMTILMNLATHTPAAPDTLSSECPAALSQLVMQLLAKDPAKRPASAEAVIQALSELDSSFATAPQNSDVFKSSGVSRTEILQLSDSSLEQPPTRILSVAKPTRGKRRVALVLFSTLLLLLAAVVYYIQTDKGTLIVEIADDTVEAKLKTTGLEVRDTTSGRTFSIQAVGALREASGNYKLVDGQGLKLVVLDAEGLELTTNEFKLTRDGKVRVRVTAAANGEASISSPQSLARNSDRRAAEYVLSVSGSIAIKEKNQERQIWAVGDLPLTAFELTNVDLQRNQQVTDSGLASFQDCKNLKHLGLASSKVGDEALAFFGNCQNLEFLELDSCNVGSSGLAHFQNCPNLVHLGLGLTRVSDADLKHFRHCQKLKTLGLRNTQVSDAGLAHLKECKNIEQLYLDATKVTDAGLEHVAGWLKLQSVLIRNTKVTEAGVKKLSTALPGCKIEWDGGVIEPRPTEFDRRAAEYVLSISAPGITTFIRIMAEGEKKQLAAGDTLPNTSFDLTDVVVLTNERLDDAGLARFKDCRKLEYLQLGYNAISDAGLEAFQGSTSIKILGLTATKVTDQGLANFQKCHDLEVLELGSTVVTDKGVALLSDCRKLTSISLGHTKVSAEGLAVFRDCADLESLDLAYHDQLTDAGMVHFKHCRKLKRLLLSYTAQISDTGLVCFKDCSELTMLRLQGTVITDAGLEVAQGFANLEQLLLDVTHITDAGLVHLKNCKKLNHLALTTTSLTDAGLETLASLPSLADLYVSNTKVTEAGVKKLAAALPKCRITWDGGVIEPKASSDR